ncbi:MAG TPA: hypothetical protein VKU41_21480 [Polyangiaceae bacterium]|nr:hypothetical protein [Polyangiaceae bacterium]
MRSAVPAPPQRLGPEDRRAGAPSDDVAELESLLLRAMKARDGAAALVLASRIVYVDPAHAVAQRIKSRCTQRIRAHCTREFPRADAVPRMLVTWQELKHRPLTREAAYLLTCVDGRATVEEIVDTSALTLLVAYEAFDGLVNDGIVALG